jgi:hypothetical protein
MIALLGVYDNARVSSWTKPWTLNSNISLMITIIKGAALIPVAASLGQLKWRRFWNFSGLAYMDYYDDASRGTLGSLRLLWHLKLWGFACFGALVTIAALSMDTLAQNVVDTYHKLQVIPGVATVPRTNAYQTFRPYLTGRTMGDQLPWPAMISAINYGMSYTASLFWADLGVPYVCVTGNCTLEAYQALEVTSQCRDMTDRLDLNDPEIIQMPGGPHLRKGDGYLNISTTTEYPAPDLFSDVGPLIANFKAISNTNLETLNETTAIQCVMYWAVGTYQTTNLTNYTLWEIPSSMWTNTSEEARTSHNQTDEIYLYPPECWVNGTRINEKDDWQCTYFVAPLAQLGLQNYLTHKDYGMQGEMYQTETGFKVTNLFANAMSWVVFQSLSNETYINMEKTVNNTAIMITQAVRQLPMMTEESNATYHPANGTVYQYEQFYKIQFFYLGATHFVVGGSLLFFVVTVFLTRTDHPWKSSTLPLLFHGLAPEVRSKVSEVPQMVDMRLAAEEMKVKLTMTAVGQRLVTRETLARGSTG